MPDSPSTLQELPLPNPNTETRCPSEPGVIPAPDTETRCPSEPGVIPAPVVAPGGVLPGVRRFFHAARLLSEREKNRMREEIAQVPGLMALLMKPRNGKKWSKAERTELRQKIRGLSRLGLYLTTALIPGTTLTLPLLAWWLDRRQGKRS